MKKEKEFNLSEKIGCYSQHKLYTGGHTIHDAISLSDIKEFINQAEKKGRYANGIKGNAMCITIQELKELAGEKFRWKIK